MSDDIITIRKGKRVPDHIGFFCNCCHEEFTAPRTWCLAKVSDGEFYYSISCRNCGFTSRSRANPAD